jgi:hypothetical protein
MIRSSIAFRAKSILEVHVGRKPSLLLAHHVSRIPETARTAVDTALIQSVMDGAAAVIATSFPLIVTSTRYYCSG